MIMFRTVSRAEYLITKANEKFTSGSNCSTGKWMAESLEHVITWSGKLGYSKPYYVLKVSIDYEIAELMFRMSYLDTVGPARFLEAEYFDRATIVEYIIVQ